MRQKHDRTRTILPKNFYIDNFLNDEHRQYLQHFQANPTRTLTTVYSYEDQTISSRYSTHAGIAGCQCIDL
jgi:hypothetical protein